MQTEPPHILFVNVYGGRNQLVFTALRINGRGFEFKMRKNMVERGSKITVARTHTHGIVQKFFGRGLIRKFGWSPQPAPDSFGRAFLQ